MSTIDLTGLSFETCLSAQRPFSHPLRKKLVYTRATVSEVVAGYAAADTPLPEVLVLLPVA